MPVDGETHKPKARKAPKRKANGYNRKTIKEKAEFAILAIRTRPTHCLVCEMRLMPSERAAHRLRCTGRATPDRFDFWETELAARARGFGSNELRRLGDRGALRARGGAGSTQEYLVRDLEQLEDARRLFT